MKATAVSPPRPILQHPHALLRAVARPVQLCHVANLPLRLVAETLEQMRATMWAARGVGLAAPQIGVPLRVVIVDTTDATGIPDRDRRLIEALNQELTEESTDAIRQPEGCLSVCPGETAMVTRSSRVRWRYLTPAGSVVEEEVRELVARAVLHEIDHLNGILYLKHCGQADRERLTSACRKNAKIVGPAWTPGASAEGPR